MIAAMLLAVTLAGGGEDARAWTTEDTVLQTAFVLVTAVDWGQTRSIRYELAHEGNPLLGRYPSRARIDLHFGVGVLAHTAIAWALPKPWRTYWQLTWIAVEGGVVCSNLQAGFVIRW